MPRAPSDPFRIGHRHQIHPRLRPQTSRFPGVHVLAAVVAATSFSPSAWSSGGRKSRDAAALVHTPERADSGSRTATRGVASTCAGDRGAGGAYDGPGTEPKAAPLQFTADEAKSLLIRWQIASGESAQETEVHAAARAVAQERVLRRLAGVDQAVFDGALASLEAKDQEILRTLREQGSALPAPPVLSDAARVFTAKQAPSPTPQRTVVASVAAAVATRTSGGGASGSSGKSSSKTEQTCPGTGLAPVTLWRGTTVANANGIVQTGSIGGREGGDAKVTAPTEEEAQAQVGEVSVLPEGTTDQAVARAFARGGNVVVVFEVCPDYLTKGSGPEAGWVMHPTAPVVVQAIIPDEPKDIPKDIPKAARGSRQAPTTGTSLQSLGEEEEEEEGGGE